LVAVERLVVLEFPSVAKAKQWWASDEYHDAKALRQRNSHCQNGNDLW
jgi:uncharacterized protein (DUF1330 family)